MKTNCLLCGIGGQGTVLASTLISTAALYQKLEVKASDTIGMAQRGGSVVSHVRFGKKIHSSLISDGEADVLIFEDRIEIHLNDNGPGIANVDLAMQEGFSTAPDNIRSLGFGAGMGLPNMKRYSDSIEIDTALGKGTKILMTVNLT